MAFPLITADSTDGWVDFWNNEVAPYIDALGSGGSAWPTSWTKNGRVIQTESDGLDATMTGSPSLAILLPSGSEWIVGGNYLALTEDTLLTGITPNFEGWIVPVATYSSISETWTWSHTEHATQPLRGAGVAAYVVCNADRVTSIDVTEDNQDIIPTMPVLLQRIRAAVGGGGAALIYLTQLLYSSGDPRTATTVIEELIAAAQQAAIDVIEAGGQKVTPSENSQLWGALMGLLRGVREVYPGGMRFVNAATARPGIYGTESAPDTVLHDLGGTLIEDTDDRSYAP